ncbi:MAG: metal transporter [Gemmatimonadota bacterium]
MDSRRWALGLAPLGLLAALVAVFVFLDPAGALRTGFPPVEELTIERVSLPEPGVLKVHVVNGGPEPVTIAQVMVDEAYWDHEMEGDRTIRRLGRATLTIPYPWVEGDPHEVKLVTSTGLTFTHVIEVATLTPRPNARYLTVFTLLGLYVGLIPVLIGLLWYPFLSGISRRWIHFFLSLTIGLLVFLGVDALAEAFETAEAVPDAFQGIGLVLLGLLISLIVLQAVAGTGRSSGDRPPLSDGAERLRLAYLIALGIGLHNLGEGLAIGSAYALGEIALGSFLVIGFAVHNTTEGLAIVAPVAASRPPMRHFLALGALAGLPTIAGTWIGGFSYSPILATLFLALGAGAIVQVVLQIAKMLGREAAGGVLAPLNSMGVACGLLVMYGTALLVAA